MALPAGVICSVHNSYSGKWSAHSNVLRIPGKIILANFITIWAPRSRLPAWCVLTEIMQNIIEIKI